MMKRGFLIKLFLVPVLMFGFGYLMVPIYNVFCDITGLNGTTGAITKIEASKLEISDRQIKVKFVSSVNQSGPWEFNPTEVSMMVHPGKQYATSYFAHNLLDTATVSQSVPSVAPSKAARYFNKSECFCFTEQKFAANEQREMPLIFVVDPDIPKDIDTIILSYTLFTKSGISG